MRPLSVLHVVGGYPSDRDQTKLVFVRTQIESLRDAGMDCDVLVLQGEGARKYLTGWKQVRDRLRNRDFDLIHSHYSFCGLVALGHRKPTVVSFLGSDVFSPLAADGSYRRVSQLFHGTLSNFVARRSDAVIVKSEEMGAALESESHVIPNGVDLEFFHPPANGERDTLRDRLGMDADKRYILFASNPANSVKRHGLAVAAVAEAARRMGSPVELVVVHGRPQSEAAQLMRVCDALVLSSAHEGSPNVVKEALASALPIASVDCGDVRERLDGVGGCRVVDDGSAEALGAALCELLVKREPSGGREAIQPLGLATVAGQVERVYRSVLDSRR